MNRDSVESSENKIKISNQNVNLLFAAETGQKRCVTYNVTLVFENTSNRRLNSIIMRNKFE